MNIDTHIRWMIRRDIPSVLAIENAGFEFPWSEDDFMRSLRNRGVIGMVAEVNHAVVGFMLYELLGNRIELLNFAIDPVYQRHGVGTALAANVIGKLTARRNRLLLEVRETNLPAQLFFQSHGFRAVSILRDFYEDSDEAAYLMQRKYSAKETNQPATRKAKAL